MIFTKSPTTTDNVALGDIWINGGKVLTCNGVNPVTWITSENDVAAKGNIKYAHSVLGSDAFDGLTWATAFKTIAAAVATLVAGDVLMIQGSFSEAVTLPIALTGVTILGVGTGPNQSIWTAATDAICLTINATDVLVQNIKFRPPAYTAGTPAAIELGGANYARIIGSRFQGKTGSYFGIYSPVCDSDNVRIEGCEFLYLNNVTTVYGTAILGVASGATQYSSWVVKNNDFNAPVAGLILPSRGALVADNHFRVNGLNAAGAMAAVTGSAGSKKMIDLSQGSAIGANHVHGNYLGGAYSATLYVVAAGNLDDWAGNYNIAGLTGANPA